MLLVVLRIAGCATTLGADDHAVQPQASPSAESAYPVTPFARIETGMHVAEVNRIDVDAAERFLVSSSHDKTVRVWDLATGALLQTLRVPIGEGDVGKIYVVVLSPDGSTVAVGGFTTRLGQQELIYLFDRKSGALRQRLGGLENVTYYLAFSRDGRRLAATLGSKGLRVYDTAGWKEVFADRDYDGGSYCADFAADGQLVTTSFDGFIRLYDRDLKLLRKQKAPGGERPFFARFSPDGTRIAVGYDDTTRVDVLAANDLRLLYQLYQADTKTVANGDLSKVAWSTDGRFLYAGGGYDDSSGRNLIRRWADGGRGGFTEFAVGTSTIMDLKPLRNGGLAVGTGVPLVTVVDANGRAVWQKTGEKANFRGQRGQWSFVASADGQVIRFGFEQQGKRPAEFSFRDLRLVLDPPAEPTLKGAVTETTAFAVTDWLNDEPKLNGTPLPLDAYETSRSLAVAPSGDRFLLGTEWWLRLFDANGRKIWQVAAPSIAWGVNISGDGRFALGAFGDGTIRWYDLRDGRELLAFFPHKDGKRWVAWTPEGFFAASEGGEQLLGYHLNRGAEQTPEFVSVDRLYAAFYRPDLLLARLQGDEAKVREALVTIGDINQVLAAGLPPVVTLAGPAQVKIDSRTFVNELLLTDRGGGIGPIEYRVDGVLQADVVARRPVELDRPGADGKTRRTRPLDLPPGRHEVTAVVYNADGKVASRAVTQLVEVDDPVAQPPALYGLAVGIDEYSDSALRLKYAASDAQAVASELQTRGRALFTRVDLHILTNADAKRERIERAFADFAQVVQPNDVFVLYLSGYGVVIDGTYYFVPQDVLYENQAALRAGSLSQSQLSDLLAAIKAKKSLIILDTCFAGAFRPEQPPVMSTSPLERTEQVAFSFRGLEEKTAISRLMQATGRTTFAVSTAAQQALEGYEGHGVFTYALLQGLRGAADQRGNRNGQIETDELFDYVRQTVPELTFQRWHIKQIPMRDVIGDSFAIGLRP